ncbi:DUF58 domain-containing protein [Bacillus sp. CGMCC 1.16607]|uniref:DUF58 domain-containing protein n=1 Tax=Bacillus sp. CGMCC 1.16607 TaxID=3351842 RepID=UPI00363E7B5C
MSKKWTKLQTRVRDFSIFLLIAGMVTKEPVLFALSGGGFFLLLFSLWWCKYALKGILVNIDFTKKRIFPGESTTVKMVIQCSKLVLPPAMKLTMNTSKEMNIEGLTLLEETVTDRFWTRMFGIKPRKTLIYEYKVFPNKRGVYHIYEMLIEIKDPTGLGKIVAKKPVKAELIVFPAFIEALPPKANLKGIEGNHQVKRLIHDDLSFFIGSRGYQMGDPLNRIDWKATARAGKLHTKHFAFTSQKQLILVGNLRTQEKWYLGNDPIVIERVIGLMAGLIRWCTANGYPYEWMFNIKNPYTKQVYHHKCKADNKELVRNLERLGRLKSYTMMNVEDVFVHLRETTYESAVILVVTNFVTQQMELEWKRQMEAGNTIWVIDPSAEQIEVYPYLMRKGVAIL